MTSVPFDREIPLDVYNEEVLLSDLLADDMSQEFNYMEVVGFSLIHIQ